MPRPLPPALLAALDVLRCPLCSGPLAVEERSLRCPQGHSFDVARAGYVSLLTGAPPISGDDDEMARARQRFLDGGVYDRLREEVIDVAAASCPDTLLDVGCGTGYYLAGLLEQLPSARGLGADTSARTLRFAARAHPRAAAIGADVLGPFPLREGSVDLVLDLFAPRNVEEFHRVLRPRGRLVVARPAADHLTELRRAVPGMVGADPHKEQRLDRTLGPRFDPTAERHVRYRRQLAPQAARDLVAMTPSARHVPAADLERTLVAPIEVTVSVLVSVHTPR